MAYGPMNNYMEICNDCGEFNDTFYKHWNMYWSIEETTGVLTKMVNYHANLTNISLAWNKQS